MRYITLLEFQPGLSANIMPPSSYLEKTNGTLVAEQCRTVIDANGFMVSDRPLSTDDKKVVLLGGSSIENLYIRDDARVLAQLEKSLADRGQGAKVYSAGISNAHLLHLVNILINKGIALRPEYVVWFPTSGMDVMANEVENGFWSASDAISTVRKAGKELKPDLSCEFNNRNGFDDEQRLLRTMFAICRNFGIRLLVATWPVYGTYDDFAAVIEPNRREFEECDAQMRALNDVIRLVCAQEDGDLIDFDAEMASRNRPEYFYDRNHPNTKGCALIADLTARAIAPNGGAPTTAPVTA